VRSLRDDRGRSDRVAARVTGVGVGFMALMLTWLVGSRLAALIWEPPVGPTVAILTAILVGIATALVASARFLRQVD